MAKITLPTGAAGDYSIGGIFFHDGVAEADQLTVKQKYLLTELLGAIIEGDVAEAPRPSDQVEPAEPEPEPQPRSTAEDLAELGDPAAAATPQELGGDTTGGDTTQASGDTTSGDSGQAVPGADPAADTAPPATDASALPDSTVDASSTDGTTVPTSGDDTATA